MTSGKEERPLLGAHVSIAGGVSRIAGARPADRLRMHPDFHQVARANGLSKPYSEEEIEAFKRAQAETGIKMVIAHDSYLLNLGAPDEKLRKHSVDGFHRRARALRGARRAVSDRASGLARRLGRGDRHHDHREIDRRGAQVLRRLQGQGRARNHGRAGQQSRLLVRSRWAASSTRSRKTIGCGCASTPSTPSPPATTLRTDEGYERTFARAR